MQRVDVDGSKLFLKGARTEGGHALIGGRPRPGGPLLVAEGSDIASIDDLEGMRVGVQQGTKGEAYTNENAAGADIISFPSDAEMFQAIQAGQVDALLQDLPVNLVHTAGGDFEIVEEFSTDETYGLAMKKDNTALVEAVNEQLTALRDSGDYDTLYDTYFSEG